MIKINIITTGRLKEEYLRKLEKNLLSDINRKNSVIIKLHELDDLKIAENASASEAEKVKDRESEKVLSLLDKNPDFKNTMVSLLELKGKLYAKEDFNKLNQKFLDRGYESITFIIGGSLGNSNDLIKRADNLIKLSSLTYPHQLFRIALLEIIKELY